MKLRLAFWITLGKFFGFLLLNLALKMCEKPILTSQSFEKKAEVVQIAVSTTYTKIKFTFFFNG